MMMNQIILIIAASIHV